MNDIKNQRRIFISLNFNKPSHSFIFISTMNCYNRKESNTDHELVLKEAASTLTLMSIRKEGRATNNGTLKNNGDAAYPNAINRTGTSTSTCTGDVAGDSTIPRTIIINRTPINSTSARPHHDDKLLSKEKSHASSMMETIKRAVLCRLRRPEDILKRNKFAVEGKSIKFPVRVSSEVDSIISMMCMLCL